MQDQRIWINVSWVMLAQAVFGAGAVWNPEDPGRTPAESAADEPRLVAHLDFEEHSPCMSGGGRNRGRRG